MLKAPARPGLFLTKYNKNAILAIVVNEIKVLLKGGKK